MDSVVALDQASALLAETGRHELQIDIVDLIYAIEFHESFILTSAASLSPGSCTVASHAAAQL